MYGYLQLEEYAMNLICVSWQPYVLDTIQLMFHGYHTFSWMKWKKVSKFEMQFVAEIMFENIGCTSQA
jgi:hypothetical protein